MHNNSSRDMLQLIAELNHRRIPMVFDAWHRQIFGTRLQGMQNIKQLVARMSSDEQANYKTVRDLHWRYEKGDYHHTSTELSHVFAFCRWLVRIYSATKHQNPREFEMDPAKMTSVEPCPKDSYSVSLLLTEKM